MSKKKKKNKIISVFAFFPLLRSPPGPKWAGGLQAQVAPAPPGRQRGGGKGCGAGAGPSCREVWETWVPAGSELPPALYQKQHRCLANVTPPPASQLGGPFPPAPRHRPFPSPPPAPRQDGARWDGARWDALASGWPRGWGPRQGRQSVMSHGGVLTRSTAHLGASADQAISSPVPLMTFQGAAAEMPAQTPPACPTLGWGQPGARVCHREQMLSKHGAIAGLNPTSRPSLTLQSHS